MQYAVLDIEATGGKAGTEKIIDIAIYRFDGQLVTDQFGSMVNPQRGIDQYVQKLTGITDKMVRRAPKFYELAKRVIEITEDCIIVGHGVAFDYRMLRQEFRELGYNFERPTLDTLTLSQKLLPNAASHSLGKLVKSLGIPLDNRHRADGDTRATLALFKILLEKDAQKNIIQTFAKKEPNSQKQVQKLLKLEQNIPSDTGVLYFHNKKGKIIHIAAARNMARKINDIFTQKNENARRIQSLTEKITFEKTGNLLIALLKQKEDEYNKKFIIPLKSKEYQKAIYVKDNDWTVENILKNKKRPLYIVTHTKRGFKKINEWDKKFNHTSFSKKLNAIKTSLDFPHQSFIVIDKGRNPKEKSFIEIQDKKIIGYGFYTFHNQLENQEIREKIRIPLRNSFYNTALLKTFLQQNQGQKIVPIQPDGTIKIPAIKLNSKNDRSRQKNKR